MTVRIPLAALFLAAAAAPATAQKPDTAAYTPAECPPCAGWNAPRPPFRVLGNTYYVGTGGLSALLVTSPAGHVLVDAGLPESAPLIAANIRALGFRVEDVRLIVNSHAHYDHAGGIAALQRMSGARVAASPRSAPVIRRGQVGPDDPQVEVHLAYPPVAAVEEFRFGDTLRVGSIAIVPHRTAGHTPGGTTWTWVDSASGVPYAVVYADSQTPVSGDSFLFTRTTAYPEAIADFERGFALLESLRCDILVTPHPGASGLFDRIPVRKDGPPLVDREECRRYAAGARRQLRQRIARERGS